MKNDFFQVATLYILLVLMAAYVVSAGFASNSGPFTPKSIKGIAVLESIMIIIALTIDIAAMVVCGIGEKGWRLFEAFIAMGATIGNYYILKAMGFFSTF